MAVDRKYGKITIKGIPVGEPIFILRAQDVLAVPTIARYRNAASGVQEGRPEAEWFDGLDQTLNDFGEWQREHQDKVKVPD